MAGILIFILLGTVQYKKRKLLYIFRVTTPVPVSYLFGYIYILVKNITQNNKRVGAAAAAPPPSITYQNPCPKTLKKVYIQP